MKYRYYDYQNYNYNTDVMISYGDLKLLYDVLMSLCDYCPDFLENDLAYLCDIVQEMQR